MTPGMSQAGAETEAPILGFRYVMRPREDGTVDCEQVFMTPEDVLHPQEEDQVIAKHPHQVDCAYFFNLCVDRARRLPPLAIVRGDHLVDLGVPGVRPISPGVAVFYGLSSEPPRDVGIFVPADHGANWLFAMEVVSPNVRNNDVNIKRDFYARAGVPLYLLVDQVDDDAPRTLVVLRLVGGAYVPAPLNPDGSFDLPALGIRIAMQNDRLYGFDLQTGVEAAGTALSDRVAAMGTQLADLQARDAVRDAEMGAAAEARSDLVRANAKLQADARAEREAKEEAEKRARAALDDLAALRELVARLQSGQP